MHHLRPCIVACCPQMMLLQLMCIIKIIKLARITSPICYLQAPPLHVVTNLTTEDVQGTRRSGKGQRMDENGFTKYYKRVWQCVVALLVSIVVLFIILKCCRLVGVATVPKTDSWPIDKFLRLPDETFAVMVTQFVFPQLEPQTTLT